MAYIPKALRDKIAAEARFRCGYCLTEQRVSGAQMHVEHIIPEARGGTSEESNLWLSCAWCNSFKGAQTEAVDPQMNREELVQISSEFGSPFFTAPRSAGLDTPIEIFYRAGELLKRLGIDTLYIHDVELDLLVRRESTDESKTDAINALERHRQAMLLAKAALPAVLFQRAGAAHKWDLLFSSESLAALLTFAKDYSAMLPSAKRSAVEKDLLTKGYCYPGADNVSVVVTPTLYVDFPKAVSLSGAGDMCFAVHGAMAS